LVDNELGHWVPPWEKLPYNNPTRNPLARSYSFVKTAKLLAGCLPPAAFLEKLHKAGEDGIYSPSPALTNAK